MRSRPAPAALLLAGLVPLALLFCTGAGYPETLSRIGERRADLQGRLRTAKPGPARAAVLGSARTLAFEAITAEILPAWYGTPWDFNGMSESPGEGMIACGYLVSTVLRDAGFRVERIRLAQQASERIVRTLAPPSAITRLRGRSPGEAASELRASLADGLYVVGMDYHVAFLVLEGARVDLCHSAYVPPASVVCEPAATSPGFVSDLYVVGPALSDERIADWLEGKPIVTVRK